MLIKEKSSFEEVLNIEGIIGLKAHQLNNVEIVNLSLQPNSKLQEHALPIEVMFYVLSGEGFVNVDGQSQKANKDNLIHCPAHAQRSWENTSKEILEILVIKIFPIE